MAPSPGATRSPADHDGDGRSARCWRCERLCPDRTTDDDAGVRRRPPAHEPPGQHEIGAHERGRPQQHRPYLLGQRPRRVGDDSKGPARRSEVAQVGFHDGHRIVGEATAEVGGPCWMSLDGDDAPARLDERSGQRSLAGTEIDDQVAGADACVGDDAPGDGRIKPMPTPSSLWYPRRGHGGPSPRTSSWRNPARSPRPIHPRFSKLRGIRAPHRYGNPPMDSIRFVRRRRARPCARRCGERRGRSWRGGPSAGRGPARRRRRGR